MFREVELVICRVVGGRNVRWKGFVVFLFFRTFSRLPVVILTVGLCLVDFRGLCIKRIDWGRHPGSG